MAFDYGFLMKDNDEKEHEAYNEDDEEEEEEEETAETLGNIIL